MRLGGAVWAGTSVRSFSVRSPSAQSPSRRSFFERSPSGRSLSMQGPSVQGPSVQSPSRRGPSPQKLPISHPGDVYGEDSPSVLKFRGPWGTNRILRGVRGFFVFSFLHSIVYSFIYPLVYLSIHPIIYPSIYVFMLRCVSQLASQSVSPSADSALQLCCTSQLCSIFMSPCSLSLSSLISPLYEQMYLLPHPSTLSIKKNNLLPHFSDTYVNLSPNLCPNPEMLTFFQILAFRLRSVTWPHNIRSVPKTQKKIFPTKAWSLILFSSLTQSGV